VVRLLVIVEGQTEESFIRNVLAPELFQFGVSASARIIGVPGRKGGNVNYDRLRGDVLIILRQDPTAYCSTLVDFYGLGKGFPGHPPPHNLANIQKAQHIEASVREDIIGLIPDMRPDIRFIPYIQLHEYEGLLFSDPEALATGIGAPALVTRFQGIRDEFKTPEDINNDPDTAPSKRILAAYSKYKKVIHGTNVAKAAVAACYPFISR
jgi:hypothetical protein